MLLSACRHVQSLGSTIHSPNRRGVATRRVVVVGSGDGELAAAERLQPADWAGHALGLGRADEEALEPLQRRAPHRQLVHGRRARGEIHLGDRRPVGGDHVRAVGGDVDGEPGHALGRDRKRLVGIDVGGRWLGAARDPGQRRLAHAALAVDRDQARGPDAPARQPEQRDAVARGHHLAGELAAHRPRATRRGR